MTQPLGNLPVFVLPEWRTRELPGLRFSERDRPLVQRLCATANSRLQIDELHDGLRIAATSWVGVVRFHEFELQIVPKLVGENLGLANLIDFASGLDALERHPAVRSFEGTGSSLFDLLALLFADACHRLVQGGLLSDYCEIEETLPVIRGRLLVRQQVLKRFSRIERLQCYYDEYLTNIVENQLLLATLTVCANRVANPTVGRRIRRLLTIFSEVCNDECDLRAARSSLDYNRRNEHYREAHALSWMLLDGLGIEDLFAAGSHRCFSFLLDMNQLFESFAARWLRQILPRHEFRVTPQRRDRTILWDATSNRPHAAVIPDLLIEGALSKGRYLPFDAKYKLYDERGIASSDIYQTFLYAYAYGEKHANLPTAVILYPSSSTSSDRKRLHIRRQSGSTSASLTAIPVHIPSALAEARIQVCGPWANAVHQVVKEAFTSYTE